MASSGQQLASLAAIEILKKGGNAIDAGVAMGICLNVTIPEIANFGGVAPIMIYSADEEKVFTISGLGTWPQSATIERIKERGGLKYEGFTCSVVPSAPDAWLTALDTFGTMSFGTVAKTAIHLAEDGFPANPGFIKNLLELPILGFEEALQKGISGFEHAKSVFFPNGKLPNVGDRIVQPDLARTLQRLVDVEAKNRGSGRHSALQAARDEFYKGKIGKDLVDYVQSKGGFLTYDDMANFHVGLEDPVKTVYRDVEVYCCGPWCQGPVNVIALNILEQHNLSAMTHNSAEYIHLLASAFDLAFADRYQYVGDPKFVEIPLNELLSKNYAKVRNKLICMNKAWGQMPPPGDPKNLKAEIAGSSPDILRVDKPILDTSYGCVVDGEGNAFSATPSDEGPLVPGLGIVVSPRGRQAWLDPARPCSVQPGKRPHLTPNPALAFKDGELFMAYGTPGGDTQAQTMMQVLINVVDFQMNVQQAIESARFASSNFPASGVPHEYKPGRLNVESRVPERERQKLRALGYDVNVYGEYSWNCGGACAIIFDSDRNVLMGGADPRRECYAIGY